MGWSGSGTGTLSGLTDVDVAAQPTTRATYALVEDPDNPGEWIKGAVGVTTPGELAAWEDNVTVADSAAHLAFPAFCIADDGTYVVAYAQSSAHSATTASVQVKRSTDRGATWGAAVEAVTAGGFEHDNPALATLSDGRIALTYSRRDGGAQVTNGAWIKFSTDNGATFGAAIEVLHGFTEGAIGGGQVVELDNGDLLTTVWGSSTSETFWSSRVSKSTDAGTTWANLATIADGPADSLEYNETGLLLRSDGTLLAVVRSETGPGHYSVTSSDSGATWGTPALIDTDGTGKPHLTDDGTRIVFAYRDTPTTGKPLAVALSLDGGGTWSLVTDQTPSPAASGGQMTYGRIVVEADGRFALVHGYETSSTNSDIFFTREVTAPGIDVLSLAKAADLAGKSDTDHTHDALASDETVFAPAYTVTDGTTLDLDVTFVWGIDADSEPYYNAAGVTAGEEAVLVLDNTTGDLSLRPVEI